MIGTGFVQNPNPATLSSKGTSLAVLGYRIDPVRAMAWGTNSVSEILPDPLPTGDSYRTHCFATTFERFPMQAQATDGDSGGAIFAFNEESHRWELKGCILAVSQKSLYVAFGSMTYLADLCTYREQLAGLAGAKLLVAGETGAP